MSKLKLKKKEQFKQYLISNGSNVSDTGRLSECPVCNSQNTAQIYDGGIIHCFKDTCKIQENGGNLDLEEYVYLFGSDYDKKLIDINEIKVKFEKEIHVDVNLNHDIFTEAIEYFHNELLENNKAYNHLIKRGRTKESISHFKVGYIDNWDKLSNRLSKKYSIDQLEDCGLFQFDDDGNAKVKLNWWGYSYPIYHKGKIRTIKSKKDGSGMYIGKRYTGSDYQMFFNLEALKNMEVFLVEGEDDAMKLWELGKKNVMAILGQLSKRQIKYLKEQRNEKIYNLVFDNDEAGEKYTESFIKEFKRVNKHQVYTIPYKGKDPDVGTDFDWDGITSEIVQSEMKKLDDEQKDEQANNEFDKLDEKYIKLLVSGKIRIIMKNSLFNNWMDVSNFKLFEPSENWIIDRWLNKTKCYIDTCVDFEHPGISTTSLNLFRGFTKEALNNETDIKLIYHHIKNVLCSGDEVAYKYLMDWIAHMLQKPYEMVGTAPVFIGDQGCGKGVIIESLLGDITGRNHFMTTGHADNYTNQFNSMMEGKLLVNIDEASFSGNHNETGVLKKYIANPSILITRKGLEGYTVDNRARLIFSSNHDQPVKVEKSNRRYFILDTSNDWVYTAKKHKPEEIKKYFNLIVDLINNGGSEQFLYDMMNRDIKEFNRFHPPTTKKEMELKAEAIEGVEEWFYGCLYDRISQTFKNDIDFKATGKVSSSTLYDLYKSYNPSDRYINTTKFGRELSNLIGFKSKTISISGNKVRGWLLGPTLIDSLKKKYKEYNI